MGRFGFLTVVRCVNPSHWCGKGTKLRSVRATLDFWCVCACVSGHSSPQCGALSTLWLVALRTISKKSMWRFEMGCLQFVRASESASFHRVECWSPICFHPFQKMQSKFACPLYQPSRICLFANCSVVRVMRREEFVFSSSQVWVCFHRNWILMVGVFRVWGVFGGGKIVNLPWWLAQWITMLFCFCFCVFCHFFWFKVC